MKPKKEVKTQVCTCPYQRDNTYCHPDCLVLKAIADNGGEIEEVNHEVEALQAMRNRKRPPN